MNKGLTYIYNIPCEVCGDKFTGYPWHNHCQKCWKQKVEYFRANKIKYGKKAKVKAI